MNPHAIEGRIQSLDQALEGLKKKRQEIDAEILKAQGRLDEMWDWQRAEDKGHIQLPVFGDAEKMEAAIENRGKEVVPGIDAGEAKKARSDMASRDGQSAVDEMDGMPE
jgi:hypothetical protein